MKTEEIQARLERGYTMAIYGTRENIHEQMTNDISELLEAINYTHCCKSDSELLPKRLSNEAYKCAKTMDYNGFVNWWDKQVQVIVYAQAKVSCL